MKTKFFAMMVLLSLVLTACGKGENTSGGGGSGSSKNKNISSQGTSSPVLGDVLRDNPCRVGNSNNRSSVTIPLNINVAANQTYVGVTSEGDVAIITNQGKGPSMTAQICARQSAQSGQGQLDQKVVINSSPNCKVNEITSATMYLPSVVGGYLTLRFRPIYFSNTSLCNR